MSLNCGAIILFGLMVFYGVVTEGTPVSFKNCSGTLHSSDVHVDITPCPENPCVFKKGTTVTSTISFTPTEAVTAGTLRVYGIIGPIKYPFPLENPNACESHGLTCPLKSGVPAELKLTLPIKSEYPSVRVIAEFGMLDQGSNDVFCFQVPVQIESTNEDVQA